MRVNELMSSPVATIDPDVPAVRAWDVMQKGRLRHLVVVHGRRIVGVLSATDLGSETQGRRSERTVGELMTPDPELIDANATLRQAANKLRGNVVGCLPVLRDGRVIGVVTATEILEALARGLTRPIERGERWTLRHRGSRHRPVPQSGVR